MRMYSYEWDKETGGYLLLPAKITGVTKSVRPVFSQELRFLGLDRDYGWIFPDCEEPLMWAESRRYFYRGELVLEASGGGLYEMPALRNVVRNLRVVPVNVAGMLSKNEDIMNGLVQRTLKTVYRNYLEYKPKVSMFYAAFSGGKDSVVMLDIVQRALPHDDFVVVFGDTTMELSDTYENVERAKKRWSDLHWYTAKANFDAKETWGFVGPPARTIRWCCGVHKSAPSVVKVREILAQQRGCTLSELKNFKVLAFVGVRKEESEARSGYDMISEGNKHDVQINCNPILEWSSAELFLYLFSEKLPFHRGYRYGLHRVGCLLCPMSSSWTDCVQNRVYQDEISPYFDRIRNAINIPFQSEDEWKKYMQEGGWKKRAGGKVLTFGEDRVTAVTDKERETFILKNAAQPWKTWMKTLGDMVEVKEGVYSIRHGANAYQIEVRKEKDTVTLSLPALTKEKENVRFMYLFRNVLYKTAYCRNCGECMAECPNGALRITKESITIENCVHCGKCLEKQKGCVVARSLIIGGGNNLDVKNIDRYKTFGFRQEWVEIYLENPDTFWQSDRLGVDMFYAFDKWAREAMLIDSKKTPSDAISTMKKLGADSPLLWGYFYVNMAYQSPIINWYVRRIPFGVPYTNESLMLLLGDELKERTRKNALTSLKDTMRSSPIGWLLGQGQTQTKGRQVVSIEKTGWAEPEPLAVLYALYMFAEKMDGLYSFTLTDLLADEDEREALSPALLFGIPRDTLRPILQGLANTYGAFISVDFNKGIMENIDLPAAKTGKKPIDVLSLI